MIFSLFVFWSLNLQAAEPKIYSPQECKRLSDIPQTQAAPADLTLVRKDLLALKDLKGRSVFENLSASFVQDLEELFNRDPKTVSKLEQFYGLLYLIGIYKSLPERRIDFEAHSVRKILSSSQVFSKPDIPMALQEITLFWSKTWKRASYVVKFNQTELHLPLNQGNGFATYKEGLCQVARELVFYGGFEFDVEKTSGSHFFVSNFKDVDLFGQFGSRGTVDVDINYVSVKSVEFLKGSPLGIVRAKVSRKEFEKNEHSALLRLLTHFVTDKSTQPIDW